MAPPKGKEGIVKLPDGPEQTSLSSVNRLDRTAEGNAFMKQGIL